MAPRGESKLAQATAVRKHANPVTLTVLGSGDAFCSGGRLNAGYVIRAKDAVVLIDAGPTILAGMKRCGIDPSELRLVLITHLHGDHFAGLPFLILDYLYQTTHFKGLTIAGPRNLASRVWRLFRAMYPRTNPQPVARKLEFVVLRPDERARFGKVIVESLRTPHTVGDVSLALKVTVAGKSLVFSGDTGWTDELLDFSAGSDLTLLECTQYDGVGGTHLSYAQIIKNVNRFSTRRLILTHLGQDVLPHSDELAVETAFDGMMLTV